MKGPRFARPRSGPPRWPSPSPSEGHVWLEPGPPGRARRIGLPRSDLCRGPAATVCPHLPPWLLGSARGGAASSGGQSAGKAVCLCPSALSLPRPQTTCGPLLPPLRPGSHPRVLSSTVGWSDVETRQHLWSPGPVGTGGRRASAQTRLVSLPPSVDTFPARDQPDARPSTGPWRKPGRNRKQPPPSGSSGPGWWSGRRPLGSSELNLGVQ